MKRTLLIVATVLVALFIIGGVVFLPTQKLKTEKGPLMVGASFYPLAHFAEMVGGTHVVVQDVTPSGAEPHDYEPSLKQIADLYSSRVFLMNGSGLDPWAEKIHDDFASKGIVVVRMSDHVSLLKGTDGETVTDPHFWLDPTMAITEVEQIRDAFIAADPANASDYSANSESYVAKLEALNQEYTDGLRTCGLRDLITSHAAFGYLAKHYNLNQIAIAGLSPDAEPSTARLAEIAGLAKKDNIKYIFFETLVSPKLAETIASEVGAKTAVFNPLEGLSDDDIRGGKTYLSVMSDNLSELRTALQCK